MHEAKGHEHDLTHIAIILLLYLAFIRYTTFSILGALTAIKTPYQCFVMLVCWDAKGSHGLVSNWRHNSVSICCGNFNPSVNLHSIVKVKSVEFDFIPRRPSKLFALMQARSSHFGIMQRASKMTSINGTVYILYQMVRFQRKIHPASHIY